MDSLQTGKNLLAPSSLSIGDIIYDTKGECATVQSIQEREGSMLLLPQGQGRTAISMPLSLVEQRNMKYCVPLSFKDMEGEPDLRDDETFTIPIWEETAEIRKKDVDTGRGVRITKNVEQHNEDISLQLSRDEIEIEHVPIRKIIPSNALPLARQEGDTYIVPVFKEVLVVDKKICLEEEIHIRRHSRQEQHTQTVPLKSETVSVERFDEKSRPH